MVAATSNSASFSSLKVESGDRKTGGSHNALLIVPDEPNDNNKSPTSESKRKGSWTDIFFPGRSRSKSTSSSPRKSPTERKRSVFAKFIHFGKKSPTKDITSPDANSQEISAVESSDTPRVSVTDTSENEPHEELMISSPTSGNEPKASEQDILGILEAAHSQMDRTPVEDDAQTIPLPLPPLNLRKKLKRRESTIDDDVQSLPEVLPSSRSRDMSRMTDNVDHHNDAHVETVVVQIESYIDRGDNSSESEIGIDENKLRARKKIGADGKSVSESEDDFEAQNLLTQDSIDYDESSFSESVMTSITQAINAQIPSETVKSPTRKDRLEVQTIPIERPRSTTPINIVPLEAYIRSTSISPDPKVEKIKLSLPGEQFTACARAKSPRKSNPSIWFEFCEKGLQSPLQRRKQRANSCFTTMESQQNDPFQTSPINAFAPNPALTPSPGNLTPVTPLEGFGDSKWPGFGDNFVNFGAIMSSNGLNDGNDKFMCNCECNASKTSANTGLDPIVADLSSPTNESNNTNNNNNLVRDSEHEYMEDQPLVSPCDCQCHRRADFALTLWKSSSFNKQDSISSDISSASSRLIGSSSSNSKCSPSEDILESINS